MTKDNLAKFGQIPTTAGVAVFKGKQVRRTIHNNEWWFSVIDVCEVLSRSTIPRRYWSDLKKKLKEEGYSELYDKIVQLKLPSSDGKNLEIPTTSVSYFKTNNGKAEHWHER